MGSLWLTMVLISWLCVHASLHTVFHKKCGPVFLLQFEGSHALGSTTLLFGDFQL